MTMAYESSDDLLSELEDLLEELEDLAIPAAREFHESVSEKCASMREQYETSESLTGAQMVALENMIGGVEKWLRR